MSTTTMALGLVRVAQGLDDEAEALLREAYESIAASEHRMHQVETLESLIQFLRDRGREDEAAELDERREDLLAAASSAERIA
jgi:hypothetical protein